MDIIFGMFLDGAEWNLEASSLRQLSVGPLAFLAWLESRLGLSGKDFSLPERIEQYRQKIRQANCDWCRQSFALDSWSTAKKLLSWRDELMQTHWDGKTGGSARLETLAAIEATDLFLAPGIGDRLRRIKTLLADLPSAKLILVEPRELLPPCWQEIFDCMEKQGWTLTSTAPSDSVAIEQLEKMLKDGAVHVFTENNEFILAEHLAGMLAQKENALHATLICQGDTHVLDRVLHRCGCGSLGESERSPAREALCILPLLCETFWEPFDPRKMLEFLCSYYCPIKGQTGWRLRRALLQKPGIGNEQWNQAWIPADDTPEFSESETQPPTDEERQEEQALIKKARPLLEMRFCPTEGIPFMELKKRCSWLEDSLKKQHDQRSVKLARSHIATLLEILDKRDKITRLELFRILETIISSGVDSQNINREVADYQFHSHPGALIRPSDFVIWWNFVDPQDSPQTYWTETELQSIKTLPDPQCFHRENFAWHNSIRQAKQLFFFLPTILNGEPVFHHSFMDEINAAIKRCTLKEKSIVKACTSGWPTGIVSPPTEKVPGLSEPAPVSELPLANNNITPEKISFTSLNSLLSCPAQWLFKYWGGLKEPDTLELPTGARLMGTFVHSIIEKLFQEQKTWTPDAAKIRAGELFDILLMREAAELAREEQTSVQGRVCDHIQQAVYHLCDEIAKRKLTVRAVEKKYPADNIPIRFFDTQLTGAADLVLTNQQQGQTYILDLKWSSKIADYQKKLDDGTALQLATYARLENGEACQARCAYFLLPKFQLLEKETIQDWSALWQQASSSYQIRMEEIRDGKLSLMDSEDSTFLQLESVCTYCDYAMLCHFKDQKEQVAKAKAAAKKELEKEITKLDKEIKKKESELAKNKEKISCPPNSWLKNLDEKINALRITNGQLEKEIQGLTIELTGLEQDKAKSCLVANNPAQKQLQEKTELHS
ncbi:MAG: PD-(D/E)XK nuclease family protein [Lentisphaeria bacterium]